jgi:hypothetical protein
VGTTLVRIVRTRLWLKSENENGFCLNLFLSLIAINGSESFAIKSAATLIER